MQKIINIDEKGLLRQLQQGDQVAFETLYDRYSRRIFINTVKLVKDEVEAQEILQDVFIKLWNNREKIDLEKSFQSYLFTVTHNLIRDFFRKVALDRKLETELIKNGTAIYEHIESNLYHKESAAILEQAIANLPTQRRKIFTLCRIEGKSYEEVATIMGISVSTVGNQLSKATRTVREHLYSTEGGITILATCYILSI